MKNQLLLWLALAALPVQAKIEHNRFVYRDWQIMSKEIVLLSDSPDNPTEIRSSDLGARLACRTVSGKLNLEGVVTREFLTIVKERELVAYCVEGEPRGVYRR